MSEKRKSAIPGVILIILGVVFLLRQLEILYVGWRQLAPIILLALGILFLVSAFTKKDKGAVFPGSVLLVLGFFFLFRNFRLLSFDYYFYNGGEYWPIFLVAFGLGFLALFVVKPHDWGVLIPGGILLFFGVIFMLERLGYFYWQDFADFWPVILIVIGLGLIIGSLKRKTE